MARKMSDYTSRPDKTVTQHYLSEHSTPEAEYYSATVSDTDKFNYIHEVEEALHVSATDCQPTDIAELIRTLQKLQNVGCTWVEIEYNVDDMQYRCVGSKTTERISAPIEARITQVRKDIARNEEAERQALKSAKSHSAAKQALISLLNQLEEDTTDGI